MMHCFSPSCLFMLTKIQGETPRQSMAGMALSTMTPMRLPRAPWCCPRLSQPISAGLRGELLIGQWRCRSQVTPLAPAFSAQEGRA